MVEETHFGFSRVPLHDKQARVDDVFHKVASRYDLMNDLMSGGLHRIWKDIFTARIRPSRKARFRHLDVAGGTGDIAFRVANAGSASTEVVVLDINAGMLEEGRRRAAKRRFDGTLDFVEANAEELPFAANSFDCYTIETIRGEGQFLGIRLDKVERPVETPLGCPPPSLLQHAGIDVEHDDLGRGRARVCHPE